MPLVCLILLLVGCVVSDYSSYSTLFDGLGNPYGGCGIPQGTLETQNFVALNVQNTPGDYSTFLKRPISDKSKVGMFNNGLNCGRWVHVILGSYCLGGANSGMPGTAFCQGGSWVDDEYSGAELELIVTDSCQDNNRWCRDDRYHLDMHTESAARFKKNGVSIGSGIYNKWNNRNISWHFIPAPNSSIEIGFLQNAQPLYYIPIAILSLTNGISGVDRLVNNQWVTALMQSDLGQQYLLPQGPPPYVIRVKDADGKYIHGGSGFKFGFPCGNSCGNTPFTKVDYVIV